MSLDYLRIVFSFWQEKRICKTSSLTKLKVSPCHESRDLGI